MVRIKQRYLLVNILYPSTPADGSVADRARQNEVPWSVRFGAPTSTVVNAQLLRTWIRNSIEELFGEYGGGLVFGAMQVKYFSAATSTAIVRVPRPHYRMVWAALTFMTQLKHDIPCVFQVVRVSGTIRKAEQEAIKRARLAILKAQEVSGHSLLLPEPQPHSSLRIDDNEMAAGIEDEDEDMADESDG